MQPRSATPADARTDEDSPIAAIVRSFVMCQGLNSATAQKRRLCRRLIDTLDCEGLVVRHLFDRMSDTCVKG
jgi:hypothetical protein